MMYSSVRVTLALRLSGRATSLRPPLWKLKIFDLEQICDAGAKPSIMDWTTFQRSHPLAGDVQKRALWLLTAMMCGCSCDLTDKITTHRAAGYTQSTRLCGTNGTSCRVWVSLIATRLDAYCRNQLCDMRQVRAEAEGNCLHN